jgi:large subunit ribosomal protein L23
MKYDAHTIVERALTTEKSLDQREKRNCVAFKVAPQADKLQIKRAIEELFKVKVVDVRTMIVRGKEKRMGRFSGRRPAWKKALVTIRQGDHIELFEKV